MSSRPDDIPQDVWDAAETALTQANVKAHMLAEPTDPIECISRAIITEREACAVIAANALTGYRPAGIDPDLWPDPAAAIRNRGEAA